MKIETDFFFAWYDFWVGLYYDRDKRTLYVCPLPCCVFKFWFRARAVDPDALLKKEKP